MDTKEPHSSATAHRRQQQIEDCLYDNLLRTPYSSISVSDLCRQVGISRKAFYNYYHSKDACFCAIIDRRLRDSMMHFPAVINGTNSLESVTALLDYWKNQKTFFDIIVQNNLLHFLILRNIHHVLNEDQTMMSLLNAPEVKADTDILACYISSQITLMLQWYDRDFDTPSEEMARKYLRLIHVPMIPEPEQ